MAIKQTRVSAKGTSPKKGKSVIVPNEPKKTKKTTANTAEEVK